MSELDRYLEYKFRQQREADEAYAEFQRAIVVAMLTRLQRESHDPGDEDRSER